MQNKPIYNYFYYLTAILLLISGLGKLFGGGEFIQGLFPFDLRWVEDGLSGWMIASVAVRILTIIELFTAITMLFRIVGKKVLVSLLLLLVIVYVVDFILGLNAVLSVNESLFYLFHPVLSFGLFPLFLVGVWMISKSTLTKTSWWSLLVGGLVIGGVFALNPLFIDDYESKPKEYTYKAKDWEIIKSKFKEQDIDLNQGNYLIAFFSTNCPHCNDLAKAFGTTYRGFGSQRKVVLVFPGNEEDTKAFIERNKSDFPYIRVTPDEFTKTAGFAFPSLFEIDNGKPVLHWTGTSFNFKVRDEQFSK